MKVNIKIGKNEKGKKYDELSGELIFEGEYLNGKRNEKGKVYNRKGKLKYETELIDDYERTVITDQDDNKIKDLTNINNIIKEYFEYTNDAIIFEGEYSKGNRNGEERLDFYYGGLRFEGEFLNGQR